MRLVRVGLLAAILTSTGAIAGCEYAPQKNTLSTQQESTRSVCKAADISSAPALAGRVTDAAGLFDTDTIQNIENQIVEFERGHAAQLVVVTARTLDNQDISAFTCNLGRKWGIGDVRREDGIIILIAPNDRKARIAVGYGLETRLSDAFLGQVMAEQMIPNFGNRKFELGVAKAITAISKKLSSI
jgi:uncharacterized protein